MSLNLFYYSILNRKLNTICLENNETIDGLYQMIAENEGINGKDFKLYLNGKYLETRDMLTNNCVIQMKIADSDDSCEEQNDKPINDETNQCEVTEQELNQMISIDSEITDGFESCRSQSRHGSDPVSSPEGLRSSIADNFRLSRKHVICALTSTPTAIEFDDKFELEISSICQTEDNSNEFFYEREISRYQLTEELNPSYSDDYIQLEKETDEYLFIENKKQ